jgi:hypothetical protein
MIGAVPEEKATRGASRYDAIIATLVGFCALCVSGYTAYMQRQQVRGAVWPILQFDSSNGPIQFTLANKGVGPGRDQRRTSNIKHRTPNTEQPNTGTRA